MTEKTLIILRGLPGSGKSTLAKQLGEGGVVYSTDDFFMVDGEYKFDPKKLGGYHADNVRRAERAMIEGITPVVVDNTNVSMYEFKNYIKLANEYGYKVEIHEPDTEWKFDADELARRNTHGVPKEVIEKMIQRWDHDVTPEKAVVSIAPWETQKANPL